jgi:hypothetical protein
MARKGDIDSKSVASRVPMKVFIRLQTKAYESKKTMSAFICDVLSDENFSKGGETKIEYKDNIVYRDRIVEKRIEVPVEVPINVRVPIDNPILIEKIESLINENKKLKIEIDKLTPQPKPKMTEGYCKECFKKQKLDEKEQCIKCGSDKISPIKNQY